MTQGEIFRNTMIKKYGSLEAWKAVNRLNASKGGKKKVPKGFAKMDSERLRLVSSIGGTIGKRK